MTAEEAKDAGWYTGAKTLRLPWWPKIRDRAPRKLKKRMRGRIWMVAWSEPVFLADPKWFESMLAKTSFTLDEEAT